MIETRDAALDPNPDGEPWYRILTPSYNPYHFFRLQFTPTGTFLMNRVLNGAQSLDRTPSGAGAS